MSVPYKELNISSDLKHHILAMEDGVKSVSTKQVVRVEDFDAYFDIGIKGFCDLFAGHCKTFVESLETNKKASKIALSHIVKFFADNQAEFKKSNVEMSFFMECFQHFGVIESLWKIVSEHDEQLISISYCFISWLCYTSGGFGEMLHSKDFVASICRSLRGSLSPKKANYGLSALMNLLLSYKNENDFICVIDYLEIILDLAVQLKFSNKAIELCYIIVVNSSNIECYPLILHFFEKIQDYSTVVVASMAFIVKKDIRLFIPIITNNFLQQLLEAAEEDITFARILEIISIGYTTMSDNMELRDRLLESISIPRVVKLLRSSEGESIVECLEFLAASAQDVMSLIVRDCRLTHSRFCDAFIFPILLKCSLREKKAAINVLKSLVVFSQATRTCLYNHTELFGDYEDLLDSCDFELQISVLKMLWRALKVSYTRGERTSEFLEGLFGSESMRSCLEKLAESQKPSLSKTATKILKIHETCCI